MALDKKKKEEKTTADQAKLLDIEEELYQVRHEIISALSRDQENGVEDTHSEPGQQ